MSFSKSIALAGVLSLASTVAAHGHVRGITVDGNWVGGFELGYAYNKPIKESIGWSTTALDNGFVEPSKFGTSDIACHLGAQPAALFAKVAAGSKIQVFWDTWPESHKGPVIDYLAPYADSAASLKFFKFAEQGLLDGASNKWASDVLIAANNSWTVTIPSDIASGKYVLRHEIIALHASGNANGAQNYPQCLNLEISGSGSVSPAGIPATQFYKSDDPGILVSIYQKLSSYVIPGPKLYSGSGSAPAPQPSPSTPGTPTETSAPTGTPAPTLPPYGNSTLPSNPTPTKLPSESPEDDDTCEDEPENDSPTPTGEEDDYETPAPVASQSAAPTVTVVPTPANPSEGETSPRPSQDPKPVDPKPTVPGGGALPANTKLSSVLSWLSNFYAKYGDGEYTSNSALRRRHAREMKF